MRNPIYIPIGRDNGCLEPQSLGCGGCSTAVADLHYSAPWGWLICHAAHNGHRIDTWEQMTGYAAAAAYFGDSRSIMLANGKPARMSSLWLIVYTVCSHRTGPIDFWSSVAVRPGPIRDADDAVLREHEDFCARNGIDSSPYVATHAELV